MELAKEVLVWSAALLVLSGALFVFTMAVLFVKDMKDE